ncbi:MAG: hypothetical protein AVDCRST_MAG93-3473, partial [uncultured Chloroflexia bacterium]
CSTAIRQLVSEHSPWMRKAADALSSTAWPGLQAIKPWRSQLKSRVVAPSRPVTSSSQAVC